MNNVGSLIVRLLLERGEYRAGLNGAVSDTQGAAQRITSAVGGIQDAVADAAGANAQAVAGAGRALSLLGPIGAAAVVVAGAVGLAYHQAGKETQAFEKSLILTGNAAGVTAGQMADMARAIDKVVGTQAQASAALAQMAGTGRVAGQDLQKFSQLALEMERTVGRSVEDTAKVFTELGKEPTKAALSLNDGVNYLTRSTYEQIRAAEELGRKEEAASIAQNAYADAMGARTKMIEANLGTLERAWRSVRDVIKEAGDAMISFGRMPTPSQAVGTALEQVQQLEAKLEELKGKGYVNNGKLEQSLALARQNLASKQHELAVTELTAAAEADLVVREKSRLELSKALEASLDKQAKKKLELAKANDLADRSEATAAERKKLLDAVEEKYKGPKGPKKKSELEEEAELLARLSGVNKDYLEQLGRLQSMRDKGTLSEDQYIDRVKELIALQPMARKFTQDQEKADREAAKAKADLEKERKKELAGMERDLAKVRDETEALKEKTEQLGLSKEAIEELEAAKLMSMATDQDMRAMRALDRGGDEAQNNLLLAQAQAWRELAAAKRQNAGRQFQLDQVKDAERAAEKAGEAWQRQTDQIEQSLTDSLMRGFENGKTAGENFRDTLANMFKTLVLRPVLSMIMSPVAGMVSSAMGGVLGNAAGQAGAAAMGGGALASTLGGLTSILGGAGTAAGYGASALFAGNGLGALSGGFGMLTSGAGAATMAQGLGMISGVLAPIAIGAGLISSLIKSTKGETRIGGQFGVAYDGAVTNYRRGQTYDNVGQQYDRDFSNGEIKALTDGIAYRLEGDPIAGEESSIRKAVQGTAATINSLLNKYGSEVSVTAFSAGLETSGKGRGGVFAGGLLSNGIGFGESGKGDNYDGTLYEKFSTQSPDSKTMLENFSTDLQQAALQALQKATDLPRYVSRVLEDVDIEELGADEVKELLTTVADLPNKLLESVGTTRDALVGKFVEGLIENDAMTAGQDTADMFVASVEEAMLNAGAGAIFDIVNSQIVSPIIDALINGATVSEALSAANTQMALDRAKVQAQAFAAIWNDPEFKALLETLRTSVGSTLGTAAAGMNYTRRYIELDPEKEDKTKEAEDPVAQRIKALKDEQKQLQIELARALGNTAEELRLLTEGMTDAERTLFLENRAIKEQIETAEERKTLQDELNSLTDTAAEALARQRNALSESNRALFDNIQALRLQKTIAEELSGVLDAWRTPEQRITAGYETLSSDLAKAGIKIDPAALAGASREQFAAAAMELYNLSTTSDETRLALVRAAGGFIALKDSADELNVQEVERAYQALERAAAAEKEVLAERIADLKALFDVLKTNVRDLYGEVESTAGMQADQGRAFIETALATAKATGYLPDSKDLADAIAGVRKGFDLAGYTSQFEKDRDRIQVANNLAGLQDLAGEQLTEAERSLKAQQEMLDLQRTAIDQARKQLDATYEGTKATGTVADALTRVEAAISALKAPSTAAGGGGGGGGAKPAAGAVLNGPNGAQYDGRTDVFYAGDTGLPYFGADLGKAAIELVQAGRAEELYQIAALHGVTADMLAQWTGTDASVFNDWAAATGRPSFDVGTNFVPEDMVANVHEGERIIPAADNRALMQALQGGGGSDAATAREIRMLREQARDQARAMTRYLSELARMQREWDATGQPPVRDETPAGVGA